MSPAATLGGFLLLDFGCLHVPDHVRRGGRGRTSTASPGESPLPVALLGTGCLSSGMRLPTRALHALDHLVAVGCQGPSGLDVPEVQLRAADRPATVGLPMGLLSALQRNQTHRVRVGQLALARRASGSSLRASPARSATSRAGASLLLVQRCQQVRDVLACMRDELGVGTGLLSRLPTIRLDR